MRKPIHTGIAFASISLTGLSLLMMVRTGTAADNEEKITPEEKLARKEAREGIEQIADMIGGDKKAEEISNKAKELAEKMMKADYGIQAVEPIMAPLKLRSKGGIGVGATPGVYDPDGIEAKIIGLAKKKLTANEMKNQLEDIAKLANITAAVAAVVDLHKPEKKIGDKKPEDWAKWAKEMRNAALDLANLSKAVKPDADAIKKTATKLNGACMDCHDKFAPKGLAPVPVVLEKGPGQDVPATDYCLAVKEIAQEIRNENLLRAGRLADKLDPKTAKLKSFMQLYRPADQGGLEQFGIEKCIAELADPKKPLDVFEALKHATEYLRVSREIVAITLIAESHAPHGKEDREKWQESAEEVQKAALELAKESRSDDFDEDKIKAAAAKIQKGCTGCHDRFRKK